MTRPSEPSPALARAARGPRLARAAVRLEIAGGTVLLLAALAALAWANSPWHGSYESAWSLDARLRLGPLSLQGDLRALVNDALMAVFFFVVGLELKHELVIGELRDWRRAAVPAVAALGGMVVPAVLYRAVNRSGAAARGWGIPMATDIAFAMAVVALLGRRVPPSLRLFLLTLAVVDDLGAIAVIAVFYSDGLHLGALAVALAALAGIAGARHLRACRGPACMVLGAVAWSATFGSGVHAAIAGAALGLLVPAHGAVGGRGRTPVGTGSVAPAQRLQAKLQPLTSLVVLPLFALANAGVSLGGPALSARGGGPVALGVVVGLLAGKTVGVGGATWLAVRTGLGRLPDGTTWAQMLGAAVLAGIGFTVSLFVTDLAFGATAFGASAKLAILLASATAALAGAAILAWRARAA